MAPLYPISFTVRVCLACECFACHFGSAICCVCLHSHTVRKFNRNVPTVQLDQQDLKCTLSHHLLSVISPSCSVLLVVGHCCWQYLHMHSPLVKHASFSLRRIVELSDSKAHSSGGRSRPSFPFSAARCNTPCQGRRQG